MLFTLNIEIPEGKLEKAFERQTLQREKVKIQLKIRQNAQAIIDNSFNIFN